VPDESEDISFDEAEEPAAGAGEIGKPGEPARLSGAGDAKNQRDYDVEHYLRVLVTSYASRLRKAYSPEDFEQLFRLDEQLGLFDRPIEHIHPLWIRCQVEGTPE